jgi:hypothetical protein
MRLPKILRHQKNYRIKLILSATAFGLFIACAVELLVVLNTHPKTTLEIFTEYFQSNPPAMRNEPYWSSDFIQLSLKHLANVNLWRYDERGFWIANDEQGHYFNAEGGFRRTVGQPLNWKQTVWLIGDSVVYNSILPDIYTSASALQALLPDIRIMNVGMIPATAAQQLHRIQTLPLNNGDIVIIYDDFSDVFDKTFDPAIFKKTIKSIETIVDNAGAKFIICAPPMLFSRVLTEEEQLYAERTFYDDNLRANLHTNWPGYEAAVVSLGGFDFTHALDEIRNTSSVFIDATHMNSLGNHEMAALLREVILR